MKSRNPDSSISVAESADRFGVRSAVSRTPDLRVDSFVGDQFLFLEVLRGEVLRDADSPPAAIMLRVSRSLKNSSLAEMFSTLFSAGAPCGKEGADYIEALVGALVVEGEFENASRLAVEIFSRGREPSNLRYPRAGVERGSFDLAGLAATAADALGTLHSRISVARMRPCARDLHAAALALNSEWLPLWRGRRKVPSESCRKLMALYSEHGVGEAVRWLEAQLRHQ